DVTSHIRVARLSATKQVDSFDPESDRIDRGSNAFGKTLTPAPMFGRGAQSFATQFSLLPLKILAEAMCNVVEQLAFFLEKRTFPRDGLLLLVMDLDRPHIGAPNRDWRPKPPWGIRKIRQRVRAAKIFNPSCRIFWKLPSRWDGIEHPLEHLLRRLLAPRERRGHVIDTAQLFSTLL